MIFQNKIAKDYFYQKKYQKAFEIFSAEKDYYGAGLCCLLLKKPNFAKKYWRKNRSCRACDWGLVILDIITSNNAKKYPTFFQTRAFLEIYINLFIENGLIEWAQNLIGFCDEFYKTNPETYKFIARVLFSNGYFELAIKFCKKSLKLFYGDPEAFLILSQSYFLLGDLGEALDCINRINAMIDSYFPTKLFEKIIREEIKNKNSSENNKK